MLSGLNRPRLQIVKQDESVSLTMTYINLIWRSLGADASFGKSRKVYTIYETALFELIDVGAQGRAFPDFCNDISELTTFPLETVTNVLQEYERFLKRGASDRRMARSLLPKRKGKLPVAYRALINTADYIGLAMEKDR